ncbi:MAG: hypothetical protein H6905_08670 [Hyphomicrobiales bacterium]|nr:hypothetical protein [Hyphomicrobiales bacterium]
MMVPMMPYDEWIDEALRGVVRRALVQTAENGLPGAHHFYITFVTNAPGVEVEACLKAKYPESMTIVLQHQFRDLSVNEEAFVVTLRFQGQASQLRIPFAAITAFGDPSVNFGLQLRPMPAPQGEQDSADRRNGDSSAPKVAAQGGTATEGQVIPLDSFRKK